MFSKVNYQRMKSNGSSDEDDTRIEMYDVNRRKFKVYIYESELKKIKEWVLLHTDIETGGDLFGLWIDSHTAVVQFALGPGKNCRRRSTSFFQDVDYLATAGGYLTQKHGLCNVGQWHSHHQLSLNEPSGGDENTVWGNMPNLGLTRYIVCIANISTKRNSYVAGVNCFLFELGEQRERLPVLKGEFEMLPESSPLTKHCGNVAEISEGAERVSRNPSQNPDTALEYFMRTLSSYWFKLVNSSRKQKIVIFVLFLVILVIIIAAVAGVVSEDHTYPTRMGNATRSQLL